MDIRAKQGQFSPLSPCHARPDDAPEGIRQSTYVKKGEEMTKQAISWRTSTNNGLHVATTYTDGSVKLLNTQSGASITLKLNDKQTSKLLDVIFERN